MKSTDEALHILLSLAAKALTDGFPPPRGDMPPNEYATSIVAHTIAGAFEDHRRRMLMPPTGGLMCEAQWSPEPGLLVKCERPYHSGPHRSVTTIDGMRRSFTWTDDAEGASYAPEPEPTEEPPTEPECDSCGKPIHFGLAHVTLPPTDPNHDVRLYHPECYERERAKGASEASVCSWCGRWIGAGQASIIHHVPAGEDHSAYDVPFHANCWDLKNAAERRQL